MKDKPFIVFHDAYQYFEHRYGVKTAGSITVSPETLPGADRVKQMQEKGSPGSAQPASSLNRNSSRS